MDLAPGDICGLHHHQLDYVLFILSSATVGALTPAQRAAGEMPRGFPLRSRAVYFIPAGGKESAHNVGDSRFFEALFEIKRPARKAAERLGFVGCEALCGREPEPGRAVILDNDRVRVVETTIAPGGVTPMRRASHDTAVYVAEGAEVRVAVARGEGLEDSTEQSLESGRVLWCVRGESRSVANLGASRYREIAVEVK
jgi:quercetin dioxygenase-like cupin family protein